MPTNEKPSTCELFRELHHRRGGFIMPNAWDAGSATILAGAGFPAIATTSAGIAFSMARQDYQLSSPAHALAREPMFERIAEIVAAVSVPVNGDLEAGYGDDPDTVAGTIAMAIDAGLAGANIEDKIPGRAALYDQALALERIAAARALIDARGSAFVLTARTDALVSPDPQRLSHAIERLNRYRAAGADCLYAPGGTDPQTVATLVREIDGPINVVIGLDAERVNAHALLAAGVRRISLGGTIARATLGFMRRAAEELRDQGTIGFAEGQISGGELNAIFSG